MVEYLDEMVYLIIGGLPQQGDSAEVKVDKAAGQVQDTLLSLTEQHIDPETIDPNTTGLVRIIEKLKIRLDNTITDANAIQEQLDNKRKEFDDAMAVSRKKEQELLAEKEQLKQQVSNIEQEYEKLKDLLNQTSEQRVQTLVADLNEEKAKSERLNEQLQKTDAEKNMFKRKMKLALERIRAVEPVPDSNVAAFKPDGKIILIDNQARVVHLDIGSDDRVYRGLTFAVYDKSLPIPKDGKGKAEIEVFNVEKKFSAARITQSRKKRPIVVDDIVANLIWDSKRANVFAVAGEFDLDSNGYIEYDAVEKIKSLVGKWGGKAADTVSVNTDFLVLGSAPKILPRPTLEEREINPMAMEEYEASLKKRAHYQEVKSQADALWIPVFNAQRFLDFIGYGSQATRAGAFSF